ncbi:MAG TPA: hypothetical protein VFB80_19795 [Pirellulaceae bacterium]|nr:hypothetical protein [Pirellulaceae bacterium]
MQVAAALAHRDRILLARPERVLFQQDDLVDVRPEAAHRRGPDQQHDDEEPLGEAVGLQPVHRQAQEPRRQDAAQEALAKQQLRRVAEHVAGDLLEAPFFEEQRRAEIRHDEDRGQRRFQIDQRRHAPPVAANVFERLHVRRRHPADERVVEQGQRHDRQQRRDQQRPGEIAGHVQRQIERVEQAPLADGDSGAV